MAEIKGTSGADVYVLTTGDWYNALEGDDKVTISGRWGTVQPGAGNDTVIIDPSLKFNEATVWYWSSPQAITVDLQEGYALDGFGTRDTLVNVHTVHGFQKPGDKGYGSNTEDVFWLNPWTGNRTGQILIDGRGGSDRVIIGINNTPLSDRGELVLKGSADGRRITAWFEKTPTFTFEFRNVESFELNDNKGVLLQATASDLVSFETAGQDILLRGASGWQTSGPGKAISISYSFLTERPADGAEGGSGFTAFNAAQQQLVRDLFAKLQQQTGATFREVQGAAGDIRLGINQQADTRGYAYVPDLFRGQAKAGDVWIDVETAAVMAPGQEGYYTLLHEIGHALGLQHPLAESDTSGATVLLQRFSTLANTVMLERSAADTGGLWPSWFGAMDMQALRYLYGGKSYAAAADRYTIADVMSSGTLMVIDDGGDDTLDASGAPMGVQIDLREGYTSSIGMANDGTILRSNVSVGIGTNIENAVGSSFDDLIVGNAASNRLQGNGGSDILDGGAGVDWALFKGPRSNWTVETGFSGSNHFVTAKDGLSGVSELRNVERAQFDNAVVALDLSRTGNAGKALLVVSAVLGKTAAMAKAPLVGTVIGLLDAGVSVEALSGAIMRLPIWGGVLTATNSSEDIARYLLTVVNGTAPTAADISNAVKVITGQPQGTLLATLALSDANVAKVDLVGLSAAGGFEYPVGG